jgi:fatty acid amide hydrolase
VTERAGKNRPIDLWFTVARLPTVDGMAHGTSNTSIPETTATSVRNLCDLTASELAARIKRGDISALSAVEAYVERIERVNPSLNALVVKRYDEARAEAREIDRRRGAGEPLGPLAGVPVTIKECLDLAGTPSTFGVSSRRHAMAAHDEKHVERLRRAGAIVLGKTNVGQLLLMFETDNPLYGRTNHPHDPERSPGGSSGAEGALLASGASALGLGTDLAGSCRVPAAFCGVVAVKPTAGRCDDLGRGSIPIGQRTVASQVGVLGRCVDDVALGLEVINGGAQPELDGTLAAAMPLRDPATVDVSKLRVAYYTDDGTFAPSPAVRRGVCEAIAALEARGASVAAWSPPDVSRARDLLFGLFSADNFAGCRRTLGRDARDPRIAKIEMAARHTHLVDFLLSLDGHGRLRREVIANYGHDDTDHYWQLVEAVLDYRQRFLQAFAGFDAIVCPATSLPAFRHGAGEELVLAGAYTCLYNVLGWPAGVVPITRVRAGEESDRAASKDKMDQAARETERGSAGLPIGVQVAARPWREDIVLATAKTLESHVRSSVR